MNFSSRELKKLFFTYNLNGIFRLVVGNFYPLYVCRSAIITSIIQSENAMPANK